MGTKTGKINDFVLRNSTLFARSRVSLRAETSTRLIYCSVGAPKSASSSELRVHDVLAGAVESTSNFPPRCFPGVWFNLSVSRVRSHLFSVASGRNLIKIHSILSSRLASNVLFSSKARTSFAGAHGRSRCSRLSYFGRSEAHGKSFPCGEIEAPQASKGRETASQSHKSLAQLVQQSLGLCIILIWALTRRSVPQRKCLFWGGAH